MPEYKRFKFACTTNGWVVLDEGIILWKDEILYLLNELHEENEKLKQKNEELNENKEYWKAECLSNGSLNQILRNELDIAREKGYEPTTLFKQYISD